MTKKRERVPFLISKNNSVSPLRIQKELKKGDPNRYPLGKYHVPVVICHGSRTENAYNRVNKAIKDGGIVLNHPDKIKNASDKLKTKMLLTENNIPTTPFIAFGKDYLKSTGSDMSKCVIFEAIEKTLNYPLVIKLRSGFGGKGMSLIENRDQFIAWAKTKKRSDITKYLAEEVFSFKKTITGHLKRVKEYRMSVSPLLRSLKCKYIDPETKKPFYLENGEIISLRKLMKSKFANEGHFGRNIALGHSHFVRDFERNTVRKNVKQSWEEGIRVAVDAVETLGLDYGAVDILWTPSEGGKNGQWSVIEVNTAPSFGNINEGQTFTLNAWKQAFVHMIDYKIFQKKFQDNKVKL